MLTIAGAAYLLILPSIPMVFSPSGLIATTAGAVYASYYALPATFLFFGIGSLSYHLLKGSPSNSHRQYLLGLAAAISLLFADPIIPAWAIILIAAAVPSLFSYTKNLRLDRMIGDLSYPVYILHWPVLTAMQITTLTLWPRAVATVITTIAIAIVIRLFIEIPLERVRSSIRQSSQNKDRVPSISGGRLAMAAYIGAVPLFLATFLASRATDSPIERISISDANWTNGINKSNPSLVVVPEFVAKNLRIGDFLVFPTGGRRAQKIESTPQYSYIYLSSPPLDYEKDGKTLQFTILKDGR